MTHWYLVCVENRDKVMNDVWPQRHKLTNLMATCHNVINLWVSHYSQPNAEEMKKMSVRVCVCVCVLRPVLLLFLLPSDITELRQKLHILNLLILLLPEPNRNTLKVVAEGTHTQTYTHTHLHINTHTRELFQMSSTFINYNSKIFLCTCNNGAWVTLTS